MCGNSYLQACHLQIHKLVYTVKKPHNCHICSTLLSAARLKAPLVSPVQQVCRSAVWPLKCDQCPYLCTSSTALKSHNTKNHKYITVVEDVVATSLPQLDGHTDASDEEPYEIFKCNICHYEAYSSSEFDRHINTEHNGVPHTSQWEDNVCHFCNKSFTNTFNFKDHITVTNHRSSASSRCPSTRGSPCSAPPVGPTGTRRTSSTTPSNLLIMLLFQPA